MVRLMWAGFMGAIVLAFICAGLYAFSERADVAKASLSQVSTIVGVDANPTGNTATHVGTIDRCVSVSSVSPNNTFYMDLFVKEVTDLRWWQGTLSFDGSVVEVNSLNVDDYFLAGDPDSAVPLWDFFSCSSDKCTIGALDTANAPESGSGVLGRLKLTALRAGTSKLYFTLWWPFGLSGVYLEDQSGAPIGDIDGDPDHFFDGLVFNAIVVVDGACPTDADGDGFTNVEESVDGSDLLNAASTPEICDGIDNDLDGLVNEGYDRDPVNGTPDCSDAASDSDDDNIYNPTDTDDDNDGFSDQQEAYLATDSLADCPVNQYHSAWPLDIDNLGDLTVTGDVFNFVGIIGVEYGDPNFRRRLDLDGDHRISVTGDVFLYVGHIGATCS